MLLYDGMLYGMALMTHRATFALDEATVSRIRALAAEWSVSQAEVIRRVVAAAAQPARPDPIAMLAALHRSGQGLAQRDAQEALTEIRKDRTHWRGR